MLLATSGANRVHTTQQRQSEIVTDAHVHLYSVHATHTAAREAEKPSLQRCEDVLCGSHRSGLVVQLRLEVGEGGGLRSASCPGKSSQR